MNAAARTAVECAIARGRSLDWMIQHLGATTRDVDDTMRHLDAVNAQPDVDKPYRASRTPSRMVSA